MGQETALPSPQSAKQSVQNSKIVPKYAAKPYVFLGFAIVANLGNIALQFLSKKLKKLFPRQILARCIEESVSNAATMLDAATTGKG